MPIGLQNLALLLPTTELEPAGTGNLCGRRWELTL